MLGQSRTEQILRDRLAELGVSVDSAPRWSASPRTTTGSRPR